MTFVEIALLLFLVIDPFGNLPFILSVLRSLDHRGYVLAVGREILFAFVVLLVFTVAGTAFLDYLHIRQASLSVAGGIILFLISLKMIFSSASRMFEDGEYRENPVLVPIAMPAIAGPSSMTTVTVLTTKENVPMPAVAIAVAGVLVATFLILLTGRWLAEKLGARGLNAMEKFMGMLLNLVAVNLTLEGIQDFLGGG